MSPEISMALRLFLLNVSEKTMFYCFRCALFIQICILIDMIILTFKQPVRII